MFSAYIIFCLPLVAAAVNNLKPLTESMGQEVIEMDAPLKELPSDIEEEPSAEKDSDVKSITTQTPGTKMTTNSESRRKMKNADRPQNPQEEDEARIEKELSELYKDTDYKADSAEVSKEQSPTSVETSPALSSTMQPVNKLIGRAREEFKFQPDSNNKADVERFRTSVDVISCNKKRLIGAVNVDNEQTVYLVLSDHVIHRHTQHPKSYVCVVSLDNWIEKLLRRMVQEKAIRRIKDWEKKRTIRPASSAHLIQVNAAVLISVLTRFLSF